MDAFLTTSLGFPTLVYSVGLLVVIGLWLVSALGLLELDLVGLDLDIDDGGTADSAGILTRLGLDGLPWLIVVTLLVLFAWVITYFVQLLLLAPLPGLLRWGLGAVVLVLAPIPSILLTAFVLRPLRRMLLKLRPQPLASLLGRVAVVRTPTVDAQHGMADLDDGGAGLILQVRGDEGAALRRGDRVVLVEHVADRNVWRVVPERDYQAL